MGNDFTQSFLAEERQAGFEREVAKDQLARLVAMTRWAGIRVVSERELGLEALLERAQAQLLEARDLRLGEVVVGEVGERLPAPELERFPDRRVGALRVAGRELPAPVVEQVLGALAVQLRR
jgi:hypothetical protein